MSKKHIVIVGGNFAGLSAAGQLSMAEAKRGSDYRVTVIDPKTDFEWTPNIHEILSGIKNQQNVQISRPVITQRLAQQFTQDEVTSIDLSNKSIKLKRAGIESYDACLIACGHQLSHHGIADLEHFVTGFREAEEISRIRRKIQYTLETKGRLTLAIVGGGFSGIEALGELLRSYRQTPGLKIKVVEPSKRLLSGLPEVIADDVIKLALTHNVEFLFDQQVKTVDAEGLTLGDDTRVDAGLIIWTAGTELPDLIKSKGLDLFGNKGIRVDEYLQCTTHPGVFIAGDAAAYTSPLKKQAYHALDMGAVAGRNMLNWLEDKPLQRFSPLEKPIALAFGDLNTYLIQDQTVFASPLLAAAKEAVYQLYMAQLTAVLPVKDAGAGIADRFVGSIRNLLIPEVSRLKLLDTLRKSRVLQWGDLRDMESMAKAMLSTMISH